MTRDTPTLSRRALLAGISVAGVSAVGGTGTYAGFNDSSGSAMTFESGSIVLDITPQRLKFDQDRGMESTITVDISNTGTLRARQLVLSAVELDGSEELQRAAEVTTLSYRETDILDAVKPVAGDANGNGSFDLTDLRQFAADSGVPLEVHVGGDGLDPNGAETASITVGITFDYSQITEKGQTLSARVNFEARQQGLDDDAALTLSAEDSAEPTESGTSSNESRSDGS